MVSYLCLPVLLYNESVEGARISVLSNSIKNIAYFISILGLAFYTRSGAINKWPLIATAVGYKTNLLPALTNTLFSIHPPLLYVSTALLLFSLCGQGPKRSMAVVSIFLLSIFLGGFWSMQELSWGGWWNWDVLECGVAYIWGASVIILHNKNQRSGTARAIKLACIATLWLIYSGLNKYGLATSIHSFIASKSTRAHYPNIIVSYVYLAALLFCRGLKLAALLNCTLTLAYLSLQWCVFLKRPALFVSWAVMASTLSKRPFSAFYHSKYRPLVISILVVNSHNMSFFRNMTIPTEYISSNCAGWLWSFNALGVSCDSIVWNKMFLSKPKYTISTHFKSISTRGALGRYATLSFLK